MRQSRAFDKGGLIVAVGATGLSLYVLWESEFFSPLGAVFPRVVSIVLLVAAAILMIAVWTRGQGPAKNSGGSNARRAALALALVIWVALAPILGFALASLIGFAAVGVVAKYDRWSMQGWFAFGVATFAGVMAFYFVFSIFLNVPLPEGALFAQ